MAWRIAGDAAVSAKDRQALLQNQIRRLLHRLGQFGIRRSGSALRSTGVTNVGSLWNEQLLFLSRLIQQYGIR